MQFKKYSHQYWMLQALELAQNIKDEIPIAALIVKNNDLISEATNKTEFLQDPTAHAEILAIKETAKILNNWRLNDCILYTTLEPCAMCTGAILNSRISTLVFGAYDLNAGTCSSVTNLINTLNKDNQTQIVGGILELETSKLIKDFFINKRI